MNDLNNDRDKELLPCPFCGGVNAYVQNAGWKANTFIRCPDCPSSFATSDGPRPHKDSVDAWNRRAIDIDVLRTRLLELGVDYKLKHLPEFKSIIELLTPNHPNT